jgi:outer membrane protein TolC
VKKAISACFLLLFNSLLVVAQQPLTLKQAIETAVTNYPAIKAKANYALASKAAIGQTKADYLPNLNLSAQQDYGTVNGQNGPLYGFGGFGVASSGVPLPNQNWNAAFGSLYLANLNWEFFTFGRIKERIKTAQQVAVRDQNDLQQELFNHRVKVAAAYLNLLAAQKLTDSYRKNLARADTFSRIVKTRAFNGLIAGVDSTQAGAEVSSARITLTRAIDQEQEQSNQLSLLMGVTPTQFVLDTVFVSHLPKNIEEPIDSAISKHPTLAYYQSRIDVNNEQIKYLKKFNYPSFSFVGVLQTRGSGFSNEYSTNQNAYTDNYWDGTKPTRSNYLVGIGVSWNLAQPFRTAKAVKTQRYVSAALTDEYELANQQIKAQFSLADTKTINALSNYREAPVQVKAASQAYLQKSVLYKNGLTNLVDVTQAQYALIRAETDRDIAYTNVWQALLLKAAAKGDFDLFNSAL